LEKREYINLRKLSNLPEIIISQQLVIGRNLFKLNIKLRIFLIFHLNQIGFIKTKAGRDGITF